MDIDIALDNLEDVLKTREDVDCFRSMMLQLAVQGKLVPQDPDDEPASVLLERIHAERERLVKERKIRKQEPLPPIEEDEIPFEIPEGWRWVRLGESSLIIMGQSPDSKFYNGLKKGLPFFQGKAEFGTDYPHPVKWCTEPKKIALLNDVLISVRAPVGPTNYAPFECCIGRGLAAIRPMCGASHQYIRMVLKTKETELSNSGTGSTFKAISKTDLNSILFPVPPLSEQQRIVAKVDELMALCDEVEDRIDKRNRVIRDLCESSLHQLVSASTIDERARSWSLISNEFIDLFSVRENVDSLKATILQLAVQGKLVPQDPNDEPASVLLEHIHAERERLVSEKRIRKQKSLPSIEEDEIPFEIPEGWEWVRLGDVCCFKCGGNAMPSQISKDSWILDLEEVEKGTGRLLTKSRSGEKNFNSSKTRFENGNVLYGKLRPYLDKCIIADEGGYCTTEIIPLSIYMGIYSKLLQYYLLSPFFHNYANEITYGVKMPRLGTKDFQNSQFPLPPFSEQRRIVAKVDELMTLCDEVVNDIKEIYLVRGNLTNIALSSRV